MKYVRDSIDISSFCCNPVVLKKIGKTSKNCFFQAQFALQRGQHGSHSKWKTIFFDRNNKSRSSAFRNFLSKDNLFWLSYKSFSILCDVFFIKKGSFPAKTAR